MLWDGEARSLTPIWRIPLLHSQSSECGACVVVLAAPGRGRFLGLESDEYRLEHVVETVASMGSGACARNGVVFRLEGAEELTQKRTLCGDATRLQQALSNFVGTASQFTPKGGWVCLRVVTGTRSLFVSDPNNLRCEFRYA